MNFSAEIRTKTREKLDKIGKLKTRKVENPKNLEPKTLKIEIENPFFKTKNRNLKLKLKKLNTRKTETPQKSNTPKKLTTRKS